MYSGIAKKITEKKIYKYYSYNPCMYKMFAPVINETIRFNKFKNFNDPYDCYIATSNGKSLQNIYMNTLGVCSFTSESDNLLMWSHYCSSHKGFVVEYDTETLRKKLADFNNQIEDFGMVEYSDKIKTRHFQSENSDKEIVEAVYHKPECWKYEKEIRVIFWAMKNSESFTDIQISEDCILRIILGSQFIIENKVIPSFLRKWVSEKKLYYMQLQSDRYSVLPTLVSDDSKNFNDNNNCMDLISL